MAGQKKILEADELTRSIEALENRAWTFGVDFKHLFLYFVDPVDPVRDEVVGPAEPTSATRWNRFTKTILENIGLLGMIGKA